MAVDGYLIHPSETQQHEDGGWATGGGYDWGSLAFAAGAGFYSDYRFTDPVDRVVPWSAELGSASTYIIEGLPAGGSGQSDILVPYLTYGSLTDGNPVVIGYFHNFGTSPGSVSVTFSFTTEVFQSNDHTKVEAGVDVILEDLLLGIGGGGRRVPVPVVAASGNLDPDFYPYVYNGARFKLAATDGDFTGSVTCQLDFTDTSVNSFTPIGEPPLWGPRPTAYRLSIAMNMAITPDEGNTGPVVRATTWGYTGYDSLADCPILLQTGIVQPVWPIQNVFSLAAVQGAN